MPNIEHHYIFHDGIYKLFYVPNCWRYVGSMLMLCWISNLDDLKHCWQLAVSMSDYCCNVGDKLTTYCRVNGFQQGATESPKTFAWFTKLPNEFCLFGLRKKKTCFVD